MSCLLFTFISGSQRWTCPFVDLSVSLMWPYWKNNPFMLDIVNWIIEDRWPNLPVGVQVMTLNPVAVWEDSSKELSKTFYLEHFPPRKIFYIGSLLYIRVSMSGLSCQFFLTGMSRGVPFHALHLLQRSAHPQLLCSDHDRHCLSSSLLHSPCPEEGLAYQRARINIWEGVNTEGISSQFTE